MAATLPKRFEPFVVPGGLKGQLSAASAARTSSSTCALSPATGILSLVSGGARKALYLKDGRVVFASSNLPNDRLGEILIREGKITVEEYDASIRAISKGKRQGKVLVEMGALSPKDLWEGVQFQVQEIVYSIFQWDDGQFHFEESHAAREGAHHRRPGHRGPDPGRASAAWTRAGRIQGRYPGERTWCWSACRARRCPAASSPTSSTCCGLVDGERSVLEICRESEIGDNETLKVLYALLAHGLRARQGQEGPRPRPGLRARGHALRRAELLQPDVRLHLPLHGARGRPDRGERAREVPGRAARRRARTSSRASSSRRTARSTPALVERNLNKLPEDAAARPARGRPQRAALRRAPGRQAHAGRRARGRASSGPSATAERAVAARTTQQVARRRDPAGAGPALDGLAAVAPRLIAIVGPTAAGKSALALRLARERGGEIVSCDSLQVYRGLDIGSAKPTPEERRARPASPASTSWIPTRTFSAADYARAGARGARGRSRRAARLPIVVGRHRPLPARAAATACSTGPSRDEALRRRLDAHRRALRRRAAAPAARARRSGGRRAHPAARPRARRPRARGLSRHAAARSPSTIARASTRRSPASRCCVVGLAPPRDALRAARGAPHATTMLAAGLLDEVRGLLRAATAADLRPLRAIGYRQAVAVRARRAGGRRGAA